MEGWISRVPLECGIDEVSVSRLFHMLTGRDRSRVLSDRDPIPPLLGREMVEGGAPGVFHDTCSHGLPRYPRDEFDSSLTYPGSPLRGDEVLIRTAPTPPEPKSAFVLWLECLAGPIDGHSGELSDESYSDEFYRVNDAAFLIQETWRARLSSYWRPGYAVAAARRMAAARPSLRKAYWSVYLQDSLYCWSSYLSDSLDASSVMPETSSPDGSLTQSPPPEPRTVLETSPLLICRAARLIQLAWARHTLLHDAASLIQTAWRRYAYPTPSPRPRHHSVDNDSDDDDYTLPLTNLDGLELTRQDFSRWCVPPGKPRPAMPAWTELIIRPRQELDASLDRSWSTSNQHGLSEAHTE